MLENAYAPTLPVTGNTMPLTVHAGVAPELGNVFGLLSGYRKTQFSALFK